MRYEVILTAQAKQDLCDIWRGSAEFGKLKMADDRTNAIRKKLGLLEQFPNSGRSREEVLPGLRSLPVKGFVIFYRVGTMHVEIVRVVDGRQDLDRIFEADL
jgi:toxin ParE1/3/4